MLRAIGCQPWNFDDGEHWAQRDVEALSPAQSPSPRSGDFSLSTTETARELGISVKLLERTITMGLRHELVRVRLEDGRWRYSKTSVDAYMEKRQLASKYWSQAEAYRQLQMTAARFRSLRHSDSQYFPAPELTLAGAPYWKPATLKSYKQGLDDFATQPGIPELCESLGFARATVNYWINKGVLPAPERRAGLVRWRGQDWRRIQQIAARLSRQ